MKYHEKNKYLSEVFLAIHDRKENSYYSFATCRDFDVMKVLEFAESKGMTSPCLEKRRTKVETDDTASDRGTKKQR